MVFDFSASIVITRHESASARSREDEGGGGRTYARILGVLDALQVPFCRFQVFLRGFAVIFHPTKFVCQGSVLLGL